MKKAITALTFLCLACASSDKDDDHDDALWSDVVGRTWEVVDESYAPATLKFDEDGRLAGKALNNYFASYERDGDDLSIGPIGATRMAGPEDAMAREQAYFAALGEVEEWRLLGTRLELLGDEDAVLVALQR